MMTAILYKSLFEAFARFDVSVKIVAFRLLKLEMLCFYTFRSARNRVIAFYFLHSKREFFNIPPPGGFCPGILRAILRGQVTEAALFVTVLTDGVA
jgi:hypothetical protein